MAFLWEEQAAEKTAALLEKLNPDHLPVAQVGGSDRPVFTQRLAALGWACGGEEKPFCVILSDPEKAQDTFCRDAAYLIVVSPNAGHTEFVFRTLVGDASGISGPGLTARSLEVSMKQFGFAPAGENDLRGSCAQKELRCDSIYGDTLIREVVESFKKDTDPAADSIVLVRAFKRETVVQEEKTHPFLTVLTRTQGQREQELREVLLCLSAQSCRDFELLIVGHKVAQEHQATVKRLIEETPEYLHSRIRYLPLETGGRTAPLNYGFSQARGDYVAILDDDDIVMSDWVEQFWKAARQAPGRLLHAYCVQQPWERLDNGYLRAVGSCNPIHCKPFNWGKQFVVNNCPPVSLAFPRFAFEELGIKFDETLDVTEDWDYTMRIAKYCGVQDIPVVTSVYRMWKTGNSLDLHGQTVWDECYKQITQKWNTEPLLMPAGAELQMVSKRTEMTEFGKLYLPTPEGYSEKVCVSICNESRSSELDFTFPVHKVLEGRIRLDPLDQGKIALENVRVEIQRKEGAPLHLTGDDFYANGYQYEKWFVFPKPDPQLFFVLPEPTEVESIHFKCNCERVLPEIFVQLLLNREGIVSAGLSYRGQTGGGQIPGKYKIQGTELTCSYTSFPPKEKVTELCFYPASYGGIAVQQFTARAYDETGALVPLRWKNNGFRKGDSDIFLAQPAYETRMPGVALDRLEINLLLTGRISPQTANAFLPWWKKVVRWIRSRMDRK